jgi:hypothetical protein
MSMYRRSTLPAPVRTEVCVSDLRHLDVVRRILSLLNEPAASAPALARLIDDMPVLAARLGERFAAKVGSRPATVAAELAFLGNRHLESVLFQLLEDLTDLSAEQAGVPAHGSMLPPLDTLRPASLRSGPLTLSSVIPRDEPTGKGELAVVPRDEPTGVGEFAFVPASRR